FHVTGTPPASPQRERARLIDEGRLLVSEEAWTEALAADAPLRQWCEENGMNRDRCVLPTDAAVATVAGAIGNDYPNWVRQGRKNAADPFVIAVGEARGCLVVSGEKNGGPRNPKIPYVCQQRGIAHGRFVDVIRSEGWILSR
ncbi:MAG: DUF4411 family protein, partial [Actinomycetales bacterium]|nr:DUF4411 family protein [Actinomycetales bacterium]